VIVPARELGVAVPRYKVIKPETLSKRRRSFINSSDKESETEFMDISNPIRNVMLNDNDNSSSDSTTESSVSQIPETLISTNNDSLRHSLRSIDCIGMNETVSSNVDRCSTLLQHSVKEKENPYLDPNEPVFSGRKIYDETFAFRQVWHEFYFSILSSFVEITHISCYVLLY
jgi:hypothetical protein